MPSREVTVIEVVKVKHLKIGEAKTLNRENWVITPDNRIEMIQTIGGNIVQDFGHIESGDKISCSCNVNDENKEKIFTYWNNQQKVTIIKDGLIYENMRIIVTRYEEIDMFPNNWKINFEFWRI